MSNQSWDTTWDLVFSTQEWGKYPSESLIRFVARNYYKLTRKEVKILEVGCGTGANLWYLSREKFDVYGIDGSTVAIEIARDRLKEEELRAHLTVGDIVDLPYDDDFFDAVIDSECIYCNNIINTKKILSEIKRVLKPYGKFYSRTFTNNLFIGDNYTKTAENEFTDITEGPLAGKGFVRLTPKEEIENIYGAFFRINTVDEIFWTLNNQQIKISEWIIISEKD